jgi:hypothetical protein
MLKEGIVNQREGKQVPQQTTADYGKPANVTPHTFLMCSS